MNVKPNRQQLEAIAAYSSPVASWAVKPGEYSNESSVTGHAMIATLENGWTVKVGRYGAILDESSPMLTEARSIATALKDVGISEDAIAEELVLEYGLTSDDAANTARQVFAADDAS